jgi:hypothetical protein
MENFEDDSNKRIKKEIENVLKFLFGKGANVRVIKHKKKIPINRIVVFIDGKRIQLKH